MLGCTLVAGQSVSPPEVVSSGLLEQLAITITSTAVSVELNGTAPPPRLEQLASTHTMFIVGRTIQTVFLPPLVAIGLVGNTLSFLVMIQPANRRISCSIYLAVIAFCDQGVLLVIINYWSTTDDIRWALWSDLVCKLAGYLFSLFSLASVILVTSVTVDRFVAVRFPFRAKQFCTTRRARGMCVATLLCCAVCQLPHLRYFAQVGPNCLAFGFSDDYATIFSWFNLAVNSLVPFFALCTLNGFIVATVTARRSAFGADSAAGGQGGGGDGGAGGGGGGDGRMSARDQQMVTMLLLVTTAMLVFTMPQCLRYLAYIFIDRNASPAAFALYFFWFNFSHTWFVINYSINFFLYCMGGAKFRADLKGIFCGGASDTK